MLDEVDVEVTDDEEVPFIEEPCTPAWLIWLACRPHAGAASLSECADVLEWFGVNRTRQAVENWYGNYTEYCDQEFTATPNRVAVDEKQIQLEEEQKVWLYGAIDVGENVVLHAHLSPRRATKPATRYLWELKDLHNVETQSFSLTGWAISPLLLGLISAEISITATETSLRNSFRRFLCGLTASMRHGTVVKPARNAG
jgi:transposase-like protein